jgi:mycothiol synthase
MLIGLRLFDPSDTRSVVALAKRAIPRDAFTEAAFIKKVLLDPNFRREGCLVAELDGEVAGFGLALVRRYPLEDGPPDQDRGWITLLFVAPETRRKGLGASILDGLLSYLRSSGAASVWVSPYAPGYFLPGVDVAEYADGLRFLLHRGFREVYRPLSMDASLLLLNTPEWVAQKERELSAAGVTIQNHEPELVLPLLEFMRREFPGDWQRYTRETLGRIASGRMSPDQLFVACCPKIESFQNSFSSPTSSLDASNSVSRLVLGFCQYDGERFGPFGTAADQRGRGIGAVLLFRCLHAMRTAGLHNAWFLWTDDRTARLYSAAGFSESRRFAVLRLDL